MIQTLCKVKKNEIVGKEKENFVPALNTTQKNNTHAQDQDAGGDCEALGKKIERKKTSSNEKMQKNKSLVQFQVTGSMKHWIRMEKLESIRKKFRVENESEQRIKQQHNTRRCETAAK